MSWPQVIIFDVDDVVIDMDAMVQAAHEGLQWGLAELLDDRTAERIVTQLKRSYATLRGQLRAGAPGHDDAARELVRRIEGWQAGALDAGFELKLWSRQVLLAVALQDLGLKVSPQLVHAGAEAYWAAVHTHTVIPPDVPRALQRARDAGQVVHLATNSDGWMTYDAAAETFTYDPEVSNRHKRRRLQPLLELGLSAEDITVGDPSGKPFPGFYQAVLRDLKTKTGQTIDLKQVLVVGDSLTNDISPFLDLGVPAGAWILRRDPGPTPRTAPERPGVSVIRTLDELESLSGMRAP